MERVADHPEAPRRVFERIVLRRGSLRGAGRRCGRSDMWLWRQLRQNKGLDLAKTGQVLAQLEVPLRFFYEEILDATSPYDPLWLLDHFRERQPAAENGAVEAGQGTGFLAWIRGRAQNLLVHPPAGPRGDYRRCRAELETLEERRFFDRDEAGTRLEEVAASILAQTEPSVALPRGLFGDLAFCLLIWADHQRLGGRRDEAVDACQIAFPWVERSRDRRIGGTFYLFASELLLELTQAGHALRFAERARLLFEGSFEGWRRGEWVARAHLQRGRALQGLGRPVEARVEGKLALRLAAGASWRIRVDAQLLLAELALSRGNVAAAAAGARRARRFCLGPSSFEARVCRREAEICRRLGQREKALALWERSLELGRRFSSPREVARVAVDLAEMLVEAGLLERARELAKSCTPLFEQFGGERYGGERYGGERYGGEKGCGSASGQEAGGGESSALSLWLDLFALLLRQDREGALAQMALLRRAV